MYVCSHFIGPKTGKNFANWLDNKELKCSCSGCFPLNYWQCQYNYFVSIFKIKIKIVKY